MKKEKEKWGIDGVMLGVVIVVKMGYGKGGRVWVREDEVWGEWGCEVEKEMDPVGNMEGTLGKGKVREWLMLKWEGMPYGYEMIRVWGTVAKGEEPWVWVVVMSGGIINGSVAYVEMGGELGGGEGGGG